MKIHLLLISIFLISFISSLGYQLPIDCSGDFELTIGCFTEEQLFFTGKYFPYIIKGTDGGQTIYPSYTDEDEFDLFYDRGLFCNKSEVFFEEFGENYTYEEYTDFKSELEIEIGTGITNNLLKGFLSDFEINCPKEPIEIIEEPEDRNIFIFIVFIILILGGAITFMVYHQRTRVAILCAIEDFKKKFV